MIIEERLPEGKTCSDCTHFKPRCSWYLNFGGTETHCDFIPSRFLEKPQPQERQAECNSLRSSSSDTSHAL